MGEGEYNICDINFSLKNLFAMLVALLSKIRDFRTCLEIWSFVLAGKPTDTNSHIIIYVF